MRLYREIEGLSTKAISINPIQAREIARTAAPNRHTVPIRVKLIEEIIEDGNWVMTHQGIAFGAGEYENRLVDGLHRITAIGNCTRTVPVMATWGLPMSALKGVDLGKPRTVADIVNVTEKVPYRVTKVMEAVARSMVQDFTGSAQDRVSAANLQSVILQHIEALEFTRVNSGGSILACVQGPVARAWYTEDVERLAEFLKIVKAGTSTRPEDQAAAKLALHLARVRGSLSSTERSQIYRKTESALRNFLRGREIVQLSEVKTEQFPIPDAD